MGYMNMIDVDIQELETAYHRTFEQASIAVKLGEPGFSVEHRTRLAQGLRDLGWVSPTEAAVATRLLRAEQRFVESAGLKRAIDILTPPATKVVEVKAA